MGLIFPLLVLDGAILRCNTFVTCSYSERDLGGYSLPRMKFISIVGLGGAFASLAVGQSALDSTRSVLEQWVEARKTVAVVRSDWAVEKEVIGQSVSAFERELKTLTDQLSQVDEGSTQTGQELEDVEDEKTELRLASDELKVSVARLEARVLGMSPGFPAPVMEKIEPLYNRIPKNPEDTKLGLSARLQNVVGILNELDKFNGSVAVVSELRKTESGAEVQTRVLYVGLSQAYFLDKTGEFCGFGMSSTEGWSWTTQPELGPAIAKAIGVYENSEPAVFVSLPVAVK